MLRLFKLEMTKLWSTRYFKILGVLWLIAFFSIPIGTWALLNKMDDWLLETSVKIMPSQLPIFDFVDLWQNLTWCYKCLTIFICFSVMISITNEYSYKTIRQNVIDGLSKRELWLSKITLILGLAALATAMVFILGLITGFTLSPVTGVQYIFRNIEFLAAYFFQVFMFLSFCLFVGVLIKRAGFAIALFMFWTYIVEPILNQILNWKIGDWSGDLLPMEACWNLIRMPWSKYALNYAQDFVGLQDLGIAAVWTFIFLWGSYRIIAKRDL